MKKPGFGFWLGLVSFVIVGALIWGTLAAQGNRKERQETMTSREVALTCTTDMATQYHIHPEVAIFINGEEVLVPQSLGVKPTCMTAIHTHNEKNVLHVEAPVQKDFTLGDFFAVWEKDFSRTTLLGNFVNENSEIVVTVNGEQVDTFESTILRGKDKIVISYQAK